MADLPDDIGRSVRRLRRRLRRSRRAAIDRYDHLLRPIGYSALAAIALVTVALCADVLLAKP